MNKEKKLTWDNPGRKPTSSTSEAHVSIAKDSKPWQTASEAKPEGDFKYKYHPGGNPANSPKEAPSAMHSVIIPNLNLPKVCLESSLAWLGDRKLAGFRNGYSGRDGNAKGGSQSIAQEFAVALDAGFEKQC
jgi:hypothetical protein